MHDPIDIIIPVYKNIDLVKDCIGSLRRNMGELAAFEPRIVVINDSPDDQLVMEYLVAAEKAGEVDLLISNENNIGFVRSVNKGLAAARLRGADVILVNSDAVTFKNTLAEMVGVAHLDEQIGFVSPRSNNASICTFPQTPHALAGITIDPDSCHAVWKSVAHHLPRYTFTPTAVGFYMLIKRIIIEDFHGLDEIFDVGYEEENDLVLRANKVGFRSVLANHSFAYHAGSASFLLRDIDLAAHRNGNLVKMSERHPEFLPLVMQYQASPKYRAEQMLRNLVRDEKGRLNLVVNLLSMAPAFNGTTELILRVLEHFNDFATERFNITLLAHRNVANFHGFEQFDQLYCTEELQSKYAIAVSFGQPYDLNAINIMEMLAPINVYGMLDVISWDCGHLRVEQKIDELWNYVAKSANGIIYISAFSKKIFERSFPVSTKIQSYAQLLPTKVASYAERYKNARKGASHVFVAGNHFKHKDSLRTAEQLSEALPSLQFVVLGDGGEPRGNMINLRAGDISDEDMIATIAESSVVVLPSYYEGFGFSLMHALALNKPIVARDIPATREILASFDTVEGVILFKRNTDLPEAVAKAIQARRSFVDDSRSQDWSNWVYGFVSFLDSLIESRHVYSLLETRIAEGDILRRMFDFERRLKHMVNVASLTSEEVAVVGGEAVSRTSSIFAFSDLEAMDPGSFVDFLYEQVLGRKADPSGYNHHLLLLDQGTTRRDMLESILRSEEYTSSGREVRVSGLERRFITRLKRIFNRRGGNATAAHTFSDLEAMDPGSFVNFLYEQVLGRKADPSGYNHHLLLLDQGTTRRDMLESILRSEEYTSSGREVRVSGIKRPSVLARKHLFSGRKASA